MLSYSLQYVTCVVDRISVHSVDCVDYENLSKQQDDAQRTVTIRSSLSFVILCDGYDNYREIIASRHSSAPQL